MTERNIGEEILAGIEEIKSWKAGKKQLKISEMHLPRAADVAAIRKQMRLTQDSFAALMGVSVATLRNWEQGRREPQGSARALLQVAKMQPDALTKAITPRLNDDR